LNDSVDTGKRVESCGPGLRFLWPNYFLDIAEGAQVLVSEVGVRCHDSLSLCERGFGPNAIA